MMLRELLEWPELPVRFKWPSVDLKEAISIHRDDGHGGKTWLVKPPMIKDALEKFFSPTMVRILATKRKRRPSKLSRLPLAS